MKTKHIISGKIPTVSPDTPLRDCLATMTKHGTDTLPVAQNGIYKGIIIHKDLHAAKDKESAIHTLIRKIPAISSEAHILEAIERLNQKAEHILPVISSDQHYLGSITTQSALSGIALLCNTAHPGSIIEIEMLPEDYSITQLSRLIEENRCKIINLFTIPDNTTGLLKVQIRTNCEDSSAILQALERFNYHITATYRPEGKIDARTEQRLRELMYYLEM